MRYYLLLALIVTTAANSALAQNIDLYGGRGSSQTIHHCGYLPTLNVVYTDDAVSTRIIQEKLAAMGYYRAAIDGVNGRGTKDAVRAFQSEYGLKADGVVGINTSQRLAYFTHESPNVQRCWRSAAAF